MLAKQMSPKKAKISIRGHGSGLYSFLTELATSRVRPFSDAASAPTTLAAHPRSSGNKVLILGKDFPQESSRARVARAL